MQKGLTEVFDVDSVIKTLVLCMLTIGAYLIYKLYVFSNQINKHTEYKIPTLFIVTASVLFVVSLGSLIYGLANFDDPTVLRSSIGLHVVSSIFDVTWIVMVRNRINLMTKAKKGDTLWLNPLSTSLFHVIYMQYKINQIMVKNT
jgi:hypothetical protein